MVFNLVPVPPLDGSKILFYFIKNADLEVILNRFGFMILMIIILYGFTPIQILASIITKFLIGG